jgi:hypothetical protein
MDETFLNKEIDDASKRIEERQQAITIEQTELDKR